MRRFLLTLCAVTALATPNLQAEAPQADTVTPGLKLKAGDRFIFIGDSITHQCLYTQYVENFFYIRYPHLGIKFRNAGVSGDRARNALDRFDEDIAAFKPTVATILLGMNDGSYKDFDRNIFDTYTKDMTELFNKLDAINCRVVLMSPTMFDHQAWDKITKEKPDYAKGRVVTGYNAVLAYYGKWLQQTALERGYQFVDMYSPLNLITVQERKKDPAYTLIADAIHPGPHGQYVMAKALLEQTGEAPLSVEADPTNLTHIGNVPVRSINGQPAADTTAGKIIALNKQRNEQAVNPLRGVWLRQRGMLGKKNSEPRAYEEWRKEFESKRAELDTKAAELEEEIYQTSKSAPAPIEIPQAAPAKKAA